MDKNNKIFNLKGERNEMFEFLNDYIGEIITGLFTVGAGLIVWYLADRTVNKFQRKKETITIREKLENLSNEVSKEYRKTSDLLSEWNKVIKKNSSSEKEKTLDLEDKIYDISRELRFSLINLQARVTLWIELSTEDISLIKNSILKIFEIMSSYFISIDNSSAIDEILLKEFEKLASELLGEKLTNIIIGNKMML